MIKEETNSTFNRPKERRLSSLTNEELQQLFELRANKIKLDPKGFWDNNKIIYWGEMMPRLMALYEVMLEIQSRYPKEEIIKYNLIGPYFNQLLPLNEKEYIELAYNIFRPKAGLK